MCQSITNLQIWVKYYNYKHIISENIVMHVLLFIGSSESRFELHITELIYRNIVASEGKDIFDEVGGDFKKVYSLDGPPKYSFPEVGSYFWTMREGSVENNQV